MAELQRKKHQREAVEFYIGVGLEIRVCVMLAREFPGTDADEIAHARGENRKF